MKKITLYKRSRIPLGTKNKLEDYQYKGQSVSPYDSGFVQPKGKYWKRQANKKVRKSNTFNGMNYKKLWGYFEWS